MGMRAERLTGYFWTSASKRAANSGEKTEAGSGWVSLGLISSVHVAGTTVAANQGTTDLASGHAPIVPRPDPWLPHYYRRAGFQLRLAQGFPWIHFRASR